VKELSDKTLFLRTASWYMGANVLGKPREQLNYAGGIPLCEEECRRALKNWDGFELAAAWSTIDNGSVDRKNISVPDIDEK
jgi:hypothetical protein